MARTIQAPNLENRNARLALPISTRPVYARLQRGLALGYRRNKAAGSWVARAGDGKGGKRVSNIGLADDYQDADGVLCLSYKDACAAAQRFAAGQAGAVITVDDVLREYQTDLENRGRHAGNISRLRFHMDAKFLVRPLARITSRDWLRWRDGLAAKPSLSKSSVNRILNNLKAALNAAAEHDANINPRPWRVGLKSFGGADRTRNVILDEATIRALIECAYADSEPFGLLAEVAAVTGARFSQLRRLECQNLIAGKAPRLMIPVSRKGNVKTEKLVKFRSNPISPALAAKLKVAAAGRARTAGLLVSGKAWTHGRIKRPWRRAAAAAGQDASVTMYALRHSNIVRMLLAGIPTRVVADAHDTSVLMIERNYSALIGQHTDALLRGALLDTETARADVVPMRR